MVPELLAELAREVPDYTDAKRALAKARAIRRRRRGAVAGAVAVLAILVAGATVLPRDRGPALIPAGPGPAREVPAEVGPALLLYRQRCAPPCELVVMKLANGRQYDLSHVGDLGVASLSPDGRWLVGIFTGGGGFKLLDLNGDDGPQPPLGEPLRPGPGWEPMTWSPDSRWLLFWSPVGGGGTPRYARVDLRTRQTVSYRPPAGEQVIAVLPSGELVSMASTAAGPVVPVSLRLHDLATGAARTVAVAARQPVSNGGTGPAQVTPDGSGIVLTVPAGNRSVSLVEIDLTTGAVREQHTLPPDWRPAVYTGKGIVLVAKNPTRTALLTDTNMIPTPFTPDTADLLIPGGHTWY